MRLTAVKARSDGRGGFRPFKDWKNHVGEYVEIAGQMLQVGKDGRVSIPARIMREYGTLADDGRYVVGAQTGSTHEQKVLYNAVQVVNIRNGDYETGEYVLPDDLKRDDIETSSPKDSREYYYPVW